MQSRRPAEVPLRLNMKRLCHPSDTLSIFIQLRFEFVVPFLERYKQSRRKKSFSSLIEDFGCVSPKEQNISV